MTVVRIEEGTMMRTSNGALMALAIDKMVVAAHVLSLEMTLSKTDLTGEFIKPLSWFTCFEKEFFKCPETMEEKIARRILEKSNGRQ